IAVTDNAGNTATATCYVTVPHSKKKDAIDDGIVYSIDGCVSNGARRDYAADYDKENTIKPNDLHLAQNYPNPFNPSTLITYHIPESGFVTLVVYDVIGKEVANLVSENKGKGGYSVTFDASDLPSGIYVYQLKVNSFIETKKMILMK
ncbi:MAG: T9SS type A sorting domain-containing protein, partial [Candidatus Kariarchaeaceae archaeon]